ncbi:MAG: aldehyde dehydrogenase [Alphaproteobacteria bacterium]|nr:MAG: aldehyde dehydrogenase [Alphaproteobacteria bacterium]
MLAQLLIDNAYQDAEGGRTTSRLNPVEGTVASTAAAATVADANRAADAAGAALPAWAETSPAARRALLQKAAAALDARADDIVAAMKAEIGATEPWARFNIMLATGMLTEAAALTTQVAGHVIPSNKPGLTALAVREPAGVVLGIAPWNAPVILGVRAVATPLACGNTVVLKASEICPMTHSLIGAAFLDAGFPPGVVNVVTNAAEDAPDIVGALIDHPAVRRINFTGSTKVGRIIATRAAQALKPVLLELGGKAPFLVLEDADLDEAVAAAAFGAFMNQGQICMSTERIILVDAIADRFVEKMEAKAKTLVAGDPRKAATPLGAVVDTNAVAHVLALIDDAKAHGARVLTGGNADGVIMSATLVDGVNKSMRLYGEESFGPVTAIIRVKDEAEAIAVANDSEYGLSAAVFTRDVVRGLKVARQIKSGICHINGPTVHDEAQMPFGGTKASGYGRFGGQWGIEEFTELRWITIAGGPGHYPI